MTDFTDYAETQVIDWFSQGTDITAPTNIHVALHTSDPGQAPDGSTEVGATDYSRVSTTAGSDWNATGNAPRTTDNAVEVAFDVASSDWGTISHVSLWDSETGGSCLATYGLSTTKTIAVDDQATFPVGDLSFEVD